MNKVNQVRSSELQIRGTLSLPFFWALGGASESTPMRRAHGSSVSRSPCAFASGWYFEAFMAFRLALIPHTPTTILMTSFHTAISMNCQRLRHRAMVKAAIATVIVNCAMERNRSNFPALSLFLGQYGFLPKPSTNIVQYVSI